MSLRRNSLRALMVGLVIVGLSGGAAAETAGLGITGPHSINKITVDESSSTTVSNTNNINVTNTTIQEASTGAVVVSGNTQVAGSGVSGAAVNNSAQLSTVTVNNAVPGGRGQGPGNSCGQVCVNPGQGGQGPGQGGPGGHQKEVDGKKREDGAACVKGCVLGAKAEPGRGAGARQLMMLPVTGPEIPIDVSALRAAFENAPGLGAPGLTKAGSDQYAIWLLVASILCFIGAIGSTVRVQRQLRNL